MIFTATYPATFLPELDGKGFHVRFSDLPEALTGGPDLENTRKQAADCLAEALAGRIRRGDDIPKPSRVKRAAFGQCSARSCAEVSALPRDEGDRDSEYPTCATPGRE